MAPRLRSNDEGLNNRFVRAVSVAAPLRPRPLSTGRIPMRRAAKCCNRRRHLQPPPYRTFQGSTLFRVGNREPLCAHKRRPAITASAIAPNNVTSAQRRFPARKICTIPTAPACEAAATRPRLPTVTNSRGKRLLSCKSTRSLVTASSDGRQSTPTATTRAPKIKALAQEGFYFSTSAADHHSGRQCKIARLIRRGQLARHARASNLTRSSSQQIPN